MRTQADRVSSLHERMEARKQIRERRKIRSLGALTAGLAACLFLVIYAGSAAHPGGTAGLYSGTMMLFENAGAYVLVALAAFMVGTMVTLICIHQRRTGQKQQKEQTEQEKKEETEETA